MLAKCRASTAPAATPEVATMTAWFPPPSGRTTVDAELSDAIVPARELAGLARGHLRRLNLSDAKVEPCRLLDILPTTRPRADY